MARLAGLDWLAFRRCMLAVKHWMADEGGDAGFEDSLGLPDYPQM